MTKQLSYEQDAELYALARAECTDAWIAEHPAAFRVMADDAMATYRGELGGFKRRMEFLDRLAADAAGFPPFFAWLAAPTDQHGEAA
jgi:hypothetical protein